MTIGEIEAAVLELDAHERARLAERLLTSLEELSAAEVEQLWLDEAERRDQALDRGELEAFPAEEVFREARSRLR